MRAEDLAVKREQGREIANILAQLKRAGFVFSERQEGFLECLLTLSKPPRHRGTA